MKILFSRLPSFALALFFCGHALAQDKTFKIAAIPKGTTYEFWKSIHGGVIKAQRELADNGVKVKVLWKDPLRQDYRDQQIRAVENFMARHVDNIVVAPENLEQPDFKELLNPTLGKSLN